MKLRWFIKERKTTNWNDREDKNETFFYEDEPVLQMFVKGKWVTVPTVRPKAK